LEPKQALDVGFFLARRVDHVDPDNIVGQVRGSRKVVELKRL
jgi:hypothetical protein